MSGEPEAPPAKGPWKRDSQRRVQTPRVLDENANPCVKEHQMSLNCMSEVYGDPVLCDDVFKNYRACREFWSTIVRERRRAGIVPALPPVEDRDAIKKERFDSRFVR